MSLPQCDLVVLVTFHSVLGKYVFPRGIFLLFSLMFIFIVGCFALHLSSLLLTTAKVVLEIEYVIAYPCI